MASHFTDHLIKADSSLKLTPGNEEWTVGQFHVLWKQDQANLLSINDTVYDFNHLDVINTPSNLNYMPMSSINHLYMLQSWTINGREYLGIRAGIDPCGEVDCMVGYFLIYDRYHHSLNCFGTYKAGVFVKLYDFEKDGRLEFVANNFISIHADVDQEILSSLLYRLNDQGKFEQVKDEQGNAYSISTTIFPGDSAHVPMVHMHWPYSI